MIRKSFKMLENSLKFIEETAQIFIDNQEVAVVYYRSGYSPEQYNTEVNNKLNINIIFNFL